MQVKMLIPKAPKATKATKLELVLVRTAILISPVRSRLYLESREISSVDYPYSVWSIRMEDPEEEAPH